MISTYPLRHLWRKTSKYFWFGVEDLYLKKKHCRYVMYLCSPLFINRNCSNTLHNIATFVLAWSIRLSVMLHYNALHSTIAGLGQPSWPARLTRPQPRPRLSSEVNIQQGNKISFSFNGKFVYLIFLFHILPDHQKKVIHLHSAVLGWVQCVQVSMISLPWE